MGETRQKKPSNRTLKVKQVKQRIERASSANVDFQSMSVRPSGTSDRTTQTSDSNTYLTPATLSSKTSYTSLLSSASTSSWQHNNNPKSYDPSRIEVRLTSNKGYALFATSNIPQGHIVLAEIPIIRLTAVDESDKSAAETILRERFNDLPKTFQRDFKKLHDTRKDGFSRIRSIYHSNCYNLDGSRSVQGGSCVGLKASRINHSCVPNVQFSFEEMIPQNLLEACKDNDGNTFDDRKRDASAGVMIFRALRRIAKGKEIVSNYESIYATRNQRQFQLQIHYGFCCDCDACDGTKANWEKDDDRRLEIMMLRKRVDAVEKRVVFPKQGPSSVPGTALYYLKQNKAISDTASPGDCLVPLTMECCQDMLKSLEKLELLLERAGLLGIERERVQQEQKVWARRADKCLQH